MDFTQFVSLLENEELFFPRADKFDDTFEGSLPYSHKETRKELIKDYPLEWSQSLLHRFRRVCTRHTFLNCWHKNSGESAAMWDLYLKSDQGICVQSTYESFIEAIEKEKQDIYLSKVEYIDYTEEDIPGWGTRDGLGDTLSPFIHKRESFEHEQEIRAIIHDLPWHSEENAKITAEDIRESDLDESVYEPGRSVKVDLEQLIETIRVSPEADSWVRGLVEDVCEKYGIERDLVTDSPMAEDPYY